MMTPVTRSVRAIVPYQLPEGSGSWIGRRQTFIYGRVRWVAKRVIIEWQTTNEAILSNYVIYRSQTLTWREARPIDLSIFTTAASQTNMVTYRAVDTTIHSPGPYYYWIVALTAKHNEQRFGPYAISSNDAPDP